MFSTGFEQSFFDEMNTYLTAHNTVIHDFDGKALYASLPNIDQRALFASNEEGDKVLECGSRMFEVNEKKFFEDYDGELKYRHF